MENDKAQMTGILTILLLLNLNQAPATRHYAATVPPLAMVLDELVEGRAEVVQILPSGASPHTFSPRPSDLRKVASALALFYVSDNLDGWAARLTSKKKIEILPLLPSDLRIAAVTDHHHGLENPLDANIRRHLSKDDSPDAADPHFWSDPLAVKGLLPALVGILGALDKAGLDIYRRNAENFERKILALDKEMAALFAPFKGRRVALSNPFYRYFLKRYGLIVSDVIERIPGKEATPKHLKTIITRIKSGSITAIFTMPQHSEKAAQAVAEVAGIKVIELDPLGGVDGRKTFFELIRHNARLIHGAMK